VGKNCRSFLKFPKEGKKGSLGILLYFSKKERRDKPKVSQRKRGKIDGNDTTYFPNTNSKGKREECPWFARLRHRKRKKRRSEGRGKEGRERFASTYPKRKTTPFLTKGGKERVSKWKENKGEKVSFLKKKKRGRKVSPAQDGHRKKKKKRSGNEKGGEEGTSSLPAARKEERLQL